MISVMSYLFVFICIANGQFMYMKPQQQYLATLASSPQARRFYLIQPIAEATGQRTVIAIPSSPVSKVLQNLGYGQSSNIVAQQSRQQPTFRYGQESGQQQVRASPSLGLRQQTLSKTSPPRPQPNYGQAPSGPRPQQLAPVKAPPQPQYEQQRIEPAPQQVSRVEQQQQEYDQGPEGTGESGTGAAPAGQAEPFNFEYSSTDEYGTKLSRQESGDENGVVRGSYSYTDANGLFREVEYIADASGFRATVKTNEPGTLSSNPADAQYLAQDPPQAVQQAISNIAQASQQQGSFQQRQQQQQKGYASASQWQPIYTIRK